MAKIVLIVKVVSSFELNLIIISVFFNLSKQIEKIDVLEWHCSKFSILLLTILIHT